MASVIVRPFTTSKPVVARSVITSQRKHGLRLARSRVQRSVTVNIGTTPGAPGGGGPAGPGTMPPGGGQAPGGGVPGGEICNG